MQWNGAGDGSSGNISGNTMSDNTMNDSEYDQEFSFTVQPPGVFSIDEMFSAPKASVDQIHLGRSTPPPPPPNPSPLMGRSSPRPALPPPIPSPLMGYNSPPLMARLSPPPPPNPSNLMGYNSSPLMGSLSPPPPPPNPSPLMEYYNSSSLMGRLSPPPPPPPPNPSPLMDYNSSSLMGRLSPPPPPPNPSPLMDYNSSSLMGGLSLPPPPPPPNPSHFMGYNSTPLMGRSSPPPPANPHGIGSTSVLPPQSGHRASQTETPFRSSHSALPPLPRQSGLVGYSQPNPFNYRFTKHGLLNSGGGETSNTTNYETNLEKVVSPNTASFENMQEQNGGINGNLTITTGNSFMRNNSSPMLGTTPQLPQLFSGMHIGSNTPTTTATSITPPYQFILDNTLNPISSNIPSTTTNSIPPPYQFTFDNTLNPIGSIIPGNYTTNSIPPPYQFTFDNTLNPIGSIIPGNYTTNSITPPYQFTFDNTLNPTGSNIITNTAYSTTPPYQFTKLLTFGNFTSAELEKIMGNSKLSEIACTDPKRAKRILSNRMSAEKSKERKRKYLMELEKTLCHLKAEVTMLSTKVAFMMEETSRISNENDDIRFHIDIMKEQAKTKEALNEALKKEAQQLKLLYVQQQQQMNNNNNNLTSPNFFLLDQQQQQQILSSVMFMVQTQNARQHTQLIGDGSGSGTSNDELID